jgi:hypothetical protein
VRGRRIGQGGVGRVFAGVRRDRRDHEALPDKPETINEDAFGEGWIFVVKPDNLAEEMEELLDPDAYVELIESEEH